MSDRAAKLRASDRVHVLDFEVGIFRAEHRDIAHERCGTSGGEKHREEKSKAATRSRILCGEDHQRLFSRVGCRFPVEGVTRRAVRGLVQATDAAVIYRTYRQTPRVLKGKTGTSLSPYRNGNAWGLPQSRYSTAQRQEDSWPPATIPFKTNVYSYFRLVRAAVPHLKPGAAIIATSSITGLEGSPKLLDYSATKGAINAITKTLAQNLVKKGHTRERGRAWARLPP